MANTTEPRSGLSKCCLLGCKTSGLYFLFLSSILDCLDIKCQRAKDQVDCRCVLATADVSPARHKEYESTGTTKCSSGDEFIELFLWRGSVLLMQQELWSYSGEILFC